MTTLRHARDGLHAGHCRWTDWIEEQAIETTSIRPGARRTLVEELERRDLRTLRVKAAGSGHSSSAVAQPRRDGLLVQLEQLRLDFPAMAERWWRPKARLVRDRQLEKKSHVLWRARSGTSVRALNDALAKKRLGLANLGSYDGQTLAGAISTGTHGSGLATGPMCDLVRSIELVCVVREGRDPVVRSYRIEPDKGPTDRAKFEADAGRHRMELIQSDDVFYAAVVSMGCFGVVTAITLEVQPAFFLTEQRKLVSWDAFRSSLVPYARRYPYVDATIITHPLSNRFDCLVTVREPIRVPAKYREYHRRSQLPQRNDARLIAAARGRRRASRDGTWSLSQCARLAAIAGDPLPYMLTRDAFRQEEKDHPFRARDKKWSSESYVVFRTSIGDHVMASSTEVGLDIERAPEGVDTVLALAASARKRPRRDHYFSPIGVRFSQASPHYLAMASGRTTCTIEVPLPVGTLPEKLGDGVRTRAQKEAESRRSISRLLGDVERRLMRLGGRPHWGQRHSLTKRKAKRMYIEAWDAWLAQYRRFNAFGTFDNAFTEQMGISMRR